MSLDRYNLHGEIDKNGGLVKFEDHKKEVEVWKSAAEVEAEQHDKCLKEVEGLKDRIKELEQELEAGYYDEKEGRFDD